jgi:peptidoglycan hydrolase-like protein with peptidoglycan-binding domain
MTNVRGMKKKLLFAVAAALVTLPVAAYAAVLAPGPHSSFTVRGPSIFDPVGHRFIVRGAVIAPGALTDPKGGFDAKELAGVKHDAKVLAAMGVNTVRLDVSAISNSDERLAAIRRAVTAARSARLIVILSAHGGTAEQALQFASYLAGRFHKDRGVWLQPAFDPSCDGADADRNRCISWSAWRAEQRALVHAIRSGGMHSPILLSTPRRSGDLRLLAHYHLTDPGIVYGVHFHGGPRTKLSLANRKRLGKLFAGPRTKRFPIIVDDLGRVGPSGRVDKKGWSDDFTAYVANWTINRGGDGAIGAAWTRYGPSAMRARHGSGLSTFGGIYASRFLALTYALDHATHAPRGLRGALAYGDQGHDVRVLQQDLVDRGYLASDEVTGTYDYGTQQAVMALEGYNDLNKGGVRDGIASPVVRALAAGGDRPKPKHGGPAHVEVSLGQQVLMLVRKGGTVARAIHISSGAGGKTPAGDFSVQSKATMSWSKPFKTWLPFASYFTGGYALHQYPIVPGYPASHGCVRMPSTEAQRVYAFATLHMPVFVA